MAVHSITHVEIPSKDPAQASKFYSEVFGWNNSYAEEYDYRMFSVAEGPGGGFPGLNDEYNVKPGEVLVYISTDNLEDSLAKVEAAGGKVISGRMPIEGMGAFAFFSDPTGNRMGLFEYTTPPANS